MLSVDQTMFYKNIYVPLSSKTIDTISLKHSLLTSNYVTFSLWILLTPMDGWHTTGSPLLSITPRSWKPHEYGNDTQWIRSLVCSSDIRVNVIALDAF